MMEEVICNFPKQLEYEPQITNEENLRRKNRLIVVGMGGSHLAADLLKAWRPNLDLIIHSDYGLPLLPLDALEQALIILSSYSGNTEEVLDAFYEAKNKNLATAVIAAKGELVRLAAENKSPYVKLPDTGIEPRFALGFSLRAILKIIGDEEGLLISKAAAPSLKPQELKKNGKELAERLKGYVPVIYSSRLNRPIAYNWKIKFNETAKMPAFFNIFPELNHNEMTGFDVNEKNRDLESKFYFLIIKDKQDKPRIIRRMEVLREIYVKRGFGVEIIELNGRDLFEKVFSALILVDWTTYYLALHYGVEPEAVPLVEEFKSLIK